MRIPVPHSVVRLPAAFQRLAWSNLVAQSAEQISLAAAPLVAVFALSASARETGLLQTAQTLPFLLLSIPFGVWADRRSRRTLMALAEGMRVIAMLSVLLLVGLHGLTLPWLAALGCLGATGTVAYNVAAPSLVPSLVSRESYAVANGRLELARSAAYSAGPALGGMLVGWIGAGWAYGCAAGLSALAAPSIAARIRFGRVLTIGPFCGLLASLVMVATLIVPSFWLAMLSFFLLGVGPILWVVGSTTLRQAITPDGMMGRVSAINSTATYGARPVGALLGAGVSGCWGMEVCLLVAAGAFFVQVFIIVGSAAARLDGVPEGG